MCAKEMNLDKLAKQNAVADLVLEVAQLFFRVRALGQRQGLITNWGGGAFGFLRSLALDGAMTVPQIARSRPTSRQRMQRLANELAEQGLVEFIDNPRHQRSKLVALTQLGHDRYHAMNEVLNGIAGKIGKNVSGSEVADALATLKAIGEDALTYVELDLTRP
jgi:DNA-binding MarR family transcriptional regulator